MHSAYLLTRQTDTENPPQATSEIELGVNLPADALQPANPVFDPESRYADLPRATHTTPGGDEINYVTRRFLPLGRREPQNHHAGERRTS